MKLNFLTIVFNNPTEINLLKLQAFSFQFVHPSIIDNIYILVNDDEIYFKNIENEIKVYYHPFITNKVKFIYKNELYKTKPLETSWFSQQILKLLVCHKIQGEFYCVLDSKNHFIRPVYESTFFYDKKPFLYTGDSGSMIDYYNKTCDYLNVKHPYKFNFLTTTPFILSKPVVKEMINYFEKKEKIPFEEFFYNNRNTFTEFYLYQAFLIKTHKTNWYEYTEKIHDSFMNYELKDWNSWDDKKKIIFDDKIKVFGIHRKSIQYMDDIVKQEIIEVYSTIFENNVNIKNLINNILYG